MQTLIVDLRKNPEIATFVKDMEPGDGIALYGTIKSNDEQTLAVTVSEVGDDKPDDDDDTAKPSKYDDKVDNVAGAEGDTITDETLA